MSNNMPNSERIFSSNLISRWYWITCAVFVTTINVVRADVVECGTVNLYREAIFGGQEVVKSEWPFIAALYYSKSFKYFCGGTIISRKHILTAAHCIQTKFKSATLTPDDLTVRIGAFNLTDRSDKDAVNRNVTQIYVHPGWNYNDEKYDADIAILVLNENLTFSDHIRPVCMPPRTFFIDGLNGTVVGWGKTENGSAEGIPRKIDVNAMSDEYCYETDDGIARYVAERSFCGESSGTPNEGDSGGGFFAVAGSGWVQFGTVSFIRPKGTGNSRKIALYMKLTSFRDWIAQTVEQSGGNISLATTKADLTCYYRFTEHLAYGCLLDDLNIRQENFVVETFNGLHESGKDNDDVDMISFTTGVMASLPRNFGNIFRNLKYLIVTVNTTRVSRSNFENLERLELIIFSNSSIAELDENSLWDLPNLQIFRLENSKLKSLHSGTFSRNSKLLRVDILSNALTSLPRNLFQNNLWLEYATLDDNLIATIDENIFERNIRLRLVYLQGNRLSHLSKNLFRNNPELQRINLSNNRIKTIDEGSFTANSKLIYLDLSFNELEFLPEQLLQGLESLEVIFLYRNALKSIDEQFFETNVRLGTILMGSNQLTHIPVNLFRNNSQLHVFEIDRNFIQAVDENLFEKNSLLQTVYLSSNLIAEFPRNLFRHNLQLKIVGIGGNSPQNIDENLFEWNRNLRKIYFSDNFVASLPGKLFKNNPLLEVVHFGFNSMPVIDEQIFQWNANLREVDLHSNELQHLPDRLFHNNPLLQLIDLSINLFTTLTESVFSTNSYLEKIYLKDCMLETLPRDLFRANTLLKYIDLSGNKLKFIEIDFSVFKYVSLINLSENVCIDYVFNDADGSYSSENMAEFQNLVTNNCRPKVL